jgi:tRNA-modifying protein YgfZ
LEIFPPLIPALFSATEVIMSKAEVTAAYEAAYSSAVVVDRSALGMLLFTGETRLDLIHRMSTQAVKDLKSGEGTATILTTDIGRIVDRLILYASSDKVYALTGENNAGNVAGYLMRFVFFNDDFHVEDLSADTAVFGVYGAGAQTLLTQAGFPEVDLPLHHWRQADLDGMTAYLHRTDPVAGDGYFVTCVMADKTAVWDRLVATGLAPISEAAFEPLRIEAGLPRYGHELSQAYIPLEANLWADVSFTKGCYIGQEIIARMESRGRIAKKLVRLRASEPLEVGAEITAEGQKVGTITSAAVGPDGPVALGYVRTAVLEESDASRELKAGPVQISPII